MPVVSHSLRPRQLILIWTTALSVSLIVLGELLVIDAGLAWVARGYLDSALAGQIVLIAGGAASLLAALRLLAQALRTERALAANPLAVEPAG